MDVFADVWAASVESAPEGIRTPNLLIRRSRPMA